MDDYPTVQQTMETSIEPVFGGTLDYASDGSIRGTADYVKQAVEIEVEHALITTTDKETLESFYDNHRDIEFQFTYDGDGSQYVAKFEGRPVVKWIAPNVWTVASKLKGYRV